MTEKIKINTWGCADCEYKQDFDINDVVMMGSLFPGIPAGTCPSCKSMNTRIETDVKKQITVSIATDAEIDKFVNDDGSELSNSDKVKLKKQAKESRIKNKKIKSSEG